MPAKCAACAKFVGVQQGGASCTCYKCKKMFHRACVGLGKDLLLDPKWVCPECVVSTPRGNNQETPVRSQPGASPQRNAPSQGAIDQSENQEARTLLREVREEVQAMLDEMRSTRTELQELKGRMSAVEQRQTTLEARVKAVELQVAKEGGEAATTAIQALESTIDLLRLELNDRDQELLHTDLEVSGIPEESGENVCHLVLACATKLGVELQERDIVSCNRVGVVYSAVEGAPVPRTRVIAVRLARRAARDSVLRAARVRRGLTTEGIGVRGAPKKVYFNERLTRKNRALFGLARQIRKDLHYVPHVWTRDGKIFARGQQGTPTTRIRTEQDVERVFGAEPVRRARSAKSTGQI